LKHFVSHSELNRTLVLVTVSGTETHGVLAWSQWALMQWPLAQRPLVQPPLVQPPLVQPPVWATPAAVMAPVVAVLAGTVTTVSAPAGIFSGFWALAAPATAIKHRLIKYRFMATGSLDSFVGLG
jgi:hypothetical protein